MAFLDQLLRVRSCLEESSQRYLDSLDARCSRSPLLASFGRSLDEGFRIDLQCRPLHEARRRSDEELRQRDRARGGSAFQDERSQHLIYSRRSGEKSEQEGGLAGRRTPISPFNGRRFRAARPVETGRPL